MVDLASFGKTEAFSHTVLPDRPIFICQNLGKCQKWKVDIWDILGDFLLSRYCYFYEVEQCEGTVVQKSSSQ